jgi:hypothetical protein
VIIRILSEGQFDVPDDAVAGLNELDEKLEAAVESSDAEAMGAALERVRSAGSEVAVDALVPSDLVLPHSTATLAEVKDLISGDGLIPG